MYKEYFLPEQWIFPFEDIPRGKKIVLWGAGIVGKQYYAQLQTTKWAEQILWVDKNWKRFRSIYGEKCLVNSPSEIDKDDFDYIVISVSSSMCAIDIRNEIISMGIPADKIVWFPSQSKVLMSSNPYINRLIEPAYREFEEVIKWQPDSSQATFWYEKITDKENFVVPRLVVVLTTRCSLRCNGCNNLMPLVQRYTDFPCEKVLFWINNFLNAADGCVTLELLGGEPFLYKDLNKVLVALIQEKKILRVEITTNGTIVPQNELLELLRSPKCFIKVSKYPGIKRTEKFIETIKEFDISHLVIDDVDWIDPGPPISHGKSSHKLKYEYTKCGASYTCKTLLGGKIYPCARGASLFHLGYIQESTAECIDIENNDNLRERMRDFFLKDTSVVCDYCTITDSWRCIQAGVQCETRDC
ncbi:radical SAM protein [Schwartzia succinivorans]|nr:radical SAM protein [Schwartzia succinivorans]